MEKRKKTPLNIHDWQKKYLFVETVEEKAYCNTRKSKKNETVKRQPLQERFFDDLDQAKEYARKESEEGFVQHVNKTGNNTYKVEDWLDGDDTVVSYQGGVLLEQEIGSQEETNTGLITFEQLKQACIKSYNEYSSRFTDDGDIYDDEILNELNDASDIVELVRILDGLGFNGDEAYDFIFNSILK